MNWSKLQEIAEDRGPWHAAVHGLQANGHDLAMEQQQHVCQFAYLSNFFTTYVKCNLIPCNGRRD